MERNFPKSPLARKEAAPEETKEDRFNSVRVVQMGDLTEDLEFAGRVDVLAMLDLPNFRWPTKFYKDKMGGTFFELKENQHLQTQFFVSQLLKGFLPVCELVQVTQEDDGTKYFSYLPPKDVLEKKEFDKEQSVADKLILSCLLGDRDHSIGNMPGRIIPKKNNQSVIKGNFLLWDFGQSANFWHRLGYSPDEAIKAEKPGYEEDKILGHAGGEINSFGKKFDRIKMYQDMLDTLAKMEYFYESEEGEQLLISLYKKVNVKSMTELFEKKDLKPHQFYSDDIPSIDYTLEDWRQELLKRIKTLQNICQEEVTVRKEKEEWRKQFKDL